MIRSLRATAGWSWGLIEATKPTSSLSTPSAHWSFEMCLIFLNVRGNYVKEFTISDKYWNFKSVWKLLHLSSDIFLTTSHTSVITTKDVWEEFQFAFVIFIFGLFLSNQEGFWNWSSRGKANQVFLLLVTQNWALAYWARARLLCGFRYSGIEVFGYFAIRIYKYVYFFSCQVMIKKSCCPPNCYKEYFD